MTGIRVSWKSSGDGNWVVTVQKQYGPQLLAAQKVVSRDQLTNDAEDQVRICSRHERGAIEKLKRQIVEMGGVVT